MNCKFRIFGRLDHAVRAQQGTVVISRSAGIFTVRPYRRRRTYTLPLATVAEIVCQRIIRAELAERKAAKKARRKGGR